MSFQQAVERRRSIRRCKPNGIPAELVEDIDRAHWPYCEAIRGIDRVRPPEYN